MFVGREKELSDLEKMYAKPSFQMAVIYGRRRVGKTALLDQFVVGKSSIYFTAQQKSSHLNLELFSRTVNDFFGQPASTPPFSTWSDAFSYIASMAQQAQGANQGPIVLVFDEFPYAAETEPSLPSALQIAIDHGFKETNLKLILCGSNEGFMESEVLGYKSPLYGRRTMQMRIKPFDYLDAARMLPGLEPDVAARYYATFGGTPYYLAQIDISASYEENVGDLLFSTSGLLYEEPLMLLRQELREPALYNSLLDAIGRGATTPSRIADLSGIKMGSVSKYLQTLQDLGIVERRAPVGADPRTTRKALYRFRDPFFSYWYRFVSKNVGLIEAGAGIAAAKAIIRDGNSLSTYVGGVFEDMCLQWVTRQNIVGNLPFLATAVGKWWGTNPSLREQTDIDVVAANPEDHAALVGECKWREGYNETQALQALAHRANLLGDYQDITYALFTKHEVSPATAAKAAARDDLKLVTLGDLYKGL